MILSRMSLVISNTFANPDREIGQVFAIEDVG